MGLQRSQAVGHLGLALPSADAVCTALSNFGGKHWGTNAPNATNGRRTQVRWALGLTQDMISGPQEYSPPHGTEEGESQNTKGRSSCITGPMGEKRSTLVGKES